MARRYIVEQKKWRQVQRIQLVISVIGLLAGQVARPHWGGNFETGANYFVPPCTKSHRQDISRTGVGIAVFHFWPDLRVKEGREGADLSPTTMTTVAISLLINCLRATEAFAAFTFQNALEVLRFHLYWILIWIPKRLNI